MNGGLKPAVNKKLRDQIAIGALKFNDLSQNRTRDIVFNWEKMLSFDGCSGPFLQYSHARACKLQVASRKSQDFQSLKFTDDFERKLAKKILQFSDRVFAAAENLAPNILAEFLFELCKTFNQFYENCPILNSANCATRLFLVGKFRRTLARGLELLGIFAPEKM